MALNRTGTHHPLPNGGTRFAWSRIRQFVERHRHDFHLQIDTIEQRPRNTTEILPNLPRSTCTLFSRMVVIATRARIHGCDKHESGRIVHMVLGSRNRDMPIFQWLTHHLQHLSAEFRKLIEKQHTVMSQRDLTRHRIAAATYERYRRYRVMRRTKRSLRHQLGSALKPPCHRMDLRRLKSLMQSQRRQNRREPLGHHRLARPGRPHKQYVMTSGTCHFKRPLHKLLSLDLGKIEIKIIAPAAKFGTGIKNNRLQRSPVSIEKLHNLTQALHTIHFEIVHNSSLSSIGHRKNHPLETLLPSFDSHGKSTAYRQHRPIKR